MIPNLDVLKGLLDVEYLGVEGRHHQHLVHHRSDVHHALSEPLYPIQIIYIYMIDICSLAYMQLTLLCQNPVIFFPTSNHNKASKKILHIT